MQIVKHLKLGLSDPVSEVTAKEIARRAIGKPSRDIPDIPSRWIVMWRV